MKTTFVGVEIEHLYKLRFDTRELKILYQNYSQIPNIKPAVQIAEDTNQWKFGVRSKMVVRPGLVTQAESTTALS